jgi:SagB-type dehydrogenase family enzyme
MIVTDRWPHSAEFHARSAIPGRSLRAETWTDTADWPAEWTEITVKSYPRRRTIGLPEAAAPAAGLVGLLEGRGSRRVPVPEPLPLGHLATILRYSCGVRPAPAGPSGVRPAPAGSPDPGRRVYPSAGARFPVECYLLASRCAGLDAGAYHYDPVGHRLTPLRVGDPRDHVRRAFGHPWITGSRAVLVLAAALGRSAIKYADRAYRFALVEAGHIGQNAVLVGGAVGVPATPVGGFADEPLNRLLDLAKDGELAVYTVVLP